MPQYDHRRSAFLPSLSGEHAYHPLQANSPAIKAASPGDCLHIDQLGNPRPQGVKLRYWRCRIRRCPSGHRRAKASIAVRWPTKSVPPTPTKTSAAARQAMALTLSPFRATLHFRSRCPSSVRSSPLKVKATALMAPIRIASSSSRAAP